MNWKEAFTAHLRGIPALFALVADRVQYGKRTAGDPTPAIMFRSLGDDRKHSHDGPDGLPSIRVEVECWATTAKDAEAVAATMRKRHTQGGLDGYRGLMGGGVFVQGMLVRQGDREEYRPDLAGSDDGDHKVALEVEIHYEE